MRRTSAERPAAGDLEQMRRALVTGAVLALAGGGVTIAIALLSRSRDLDQYSFGGVLGSGLTAVSGGALLLIAARRPARWTLGALILGSTVAISAGIHAAGPDLPLGGVFYLWLVVWAFLYRPLSTAVVTIGMVGVAYGIVLASQDLAIPVGVWMFMMATAVMTGVVIASLVRRADDLAEGEHAARLEIERAHGELSAWSRTLEDRVAEQVAALDVLGGLRRFVSTPVADALLADGRQELLQPHRRQIAVFFCDLRGFTAYSASAEPEEADEILRVYFELLGRCVNRHQATVGGFTVDGLMAFFNDPLPVEDPVLEAVSMAMEIRSGLEEVLARWHRQGFDLGLGIGIAYGYANIGMIGFEGRQDYSALGPVVSLAAQLCAEAADREILLDTRARAAANERILVDDERTVDLKDYADPVAAFAVAGIVTPPSAPSPS
jgi:class 3 adenylate cyclase